MAKTTTTAYLICLVGLMSSCSEPELNGHYHLMWNQNSEVFQTWNIQENRLTINPNHCETTGDCFEAHISFDGDVMVVNPWVDITYDCRYKLNKDGSIWMYGSRDTMKLVPHRNCQLAEDYFQERTRAYTDSFSLLSLTMTGTAAFPQKFQNELLIGLKKGTPFYLFNGKILELDERGLLGFPPSDSATIWVHIDQHVNLRQLVPVMRELYFLGYQPKFSSIREYDNREQIQLFSRSFEQFQEHSSGQYEVTFCEHCEAYPNETIDSVISVFWLGPDSLVIRGDTTDLFQVRNAIIRFLGQNRSTRLHSEIEINFPDTTPFEDYLKMIDEINFVHVELSDIVFYRGEDDPDAKWILQQQESNIRSPVPDQFPIRIREKIHPVKASL